MDRKPALIPATLDGDTLRQLTLAADASPWGLDDPVGLFTGVHLYDYAHAGQHALVALRPVDTAHGRRLEVVGLVSDGDRLQGAGVVAALDEAARAYGAQVLAMCTRHGHVLRALERGGWRQTGAVAIKTMGVH